MVRKKNREAIVEQAIEIAEEPDTDILDVIQFIDEQIDDKADIPEVTEEVVTTIFAEDPRIFGDAALRDLVVSRQPAEAAFALEVAVDDPTTDVQILTPDQNARREEIIAGAQARYRHNQRRRKTGRSAFRSL